MHATRHRGELHLHAGRVVDLAGVGLLRERGLPVPAPDELPTGVILGSVDLVDCVRDPAISSWADPSRWQYVLARPRLLPAAIPHRGRQYIHRLEANHSR